MLSLIGGGEHMARKATNALKAVSAEPSRLPERTGAVVGQVSAFRNGELFVEFADNPFHTALRARTTVPPGPELVGRDVMLVFEKGDPRLPIITGVLQPPAEQRSPTVEMTVDGEQVRVRGSQQIVLECGRASITLTRAGKVLIKGTYVSSQSTGVHRIKGGSLQLN
jgi:hypothetical protein